MIPYFLKTYITLLNVKISAEDADFKQFFLLSNFFICPNTFFIHIVKD